jgi:antitoxin component of RelBE/YafQ-DinJ toxin-antitoxin module
MGLTPIQVITMLYKYIERERKISFSLSIPNEKTAKAIREAKAGKGLIKSGSLDELFDKWEIE